MTDITECPWPKSDRQRVRVSNAQRFDPVFLQALQAVQEEEKQIVLQRWGRRQLGIGQMMQALCTDNSPYMNAVRKRVLAKCREIDRSNHERTTTRGDRPASQGSSSPAS